ncbi:MAG: aminopeptidase [Bacteroidetes bacterium GWF2_38_335]|nr:MAG: aminopeptidase [Bacteroidetes bacterium GWF2_38_335]OFY77559.1 MAG: aminopeptidase [Bacteroidetes bacterium RIFOXYA12_FULL_38_20]HBS87143.1 aminopeptidase [Bacteroidales bacterium]
MELLKKLCEIHAPSGEEISMKEFILKYVNEKMNGWKSQPVIVADQIQDSLVLVFGKPRLAVFAHMDSIGFTVRYDNKLVRIGSPVIESGFVLTGRDSIGNIECKLKYDEDTKEISVDYDRIIERGTSLVYKSNFREDHEFVLSQYIDNRLGVYNCLKLAETLENGIIAFSCWEEHGSGSVEVLSKLIYEKYKVSQALIADITWVTEGVFHGKGVVISMRDQFIPRQSYIRKIMDIADKAKIKYQLEVEGSGSSDGGYLQRTAFPFDWCFIGAPEDGVHSPNEKVHKGDIESMLDIYKLLFEKL